MSDLNKSIEQGEKCKLSRRDFLKLSTIAGSAAAFLGALPHIEGVFADNLGKDYNLAHAEKMIYSVCQQCNTQCGIKVKIIDQVGPEKIGVVGKIEGNPFSPWNLVPHLNYATPVNDAATIDGVLCPRGQAGLQTVYDPYRLIKVLKRAGKRGENKWMTIPFEQAVDEIVEGDDKQGSWEVLERAKPDVVVLGYDQNRLYKALLHYIEGRRASRVKVIMAPAYHPDRFHSSKLNN